MSSTSPRGFLAHVGRAAACDAALLRRYPKLLRSALAAVLIPALYALIVLSSLWDPNARTPQLPVALVNQDDGLRVGPRQINLGAEVLQTLRAQGMFGYREFGDTEEARHAVREGRLAFAVVLPPDFSRQALVGAEPGAGQLTIYLSEGNNYVASSIARRFAPELAYRVNETLNERRWALVLDGTANLRSDLASLRHGIGLLVDGADRAASSARLAREGGQELVAGLLIARNAGLRLQAGSTQLADASAQFGMGLRQLDEGMRSINAHAVSESDLQALRQGFPALHRGHVELAAGLRQLHAGASALHKGAVAFKLEAGELPIVGERIALAADPVVLGAGQLEAGLNAARGGQGQLAVATAHLAEGSDRLATGLLRQSTAFTQLAARLPDVTQVDGLVAGAAQSASGSAALADGLRQLHEGQGRLQRGLARLGDGSAELAVGLHVLQASLPGEMPSLGGTPAGLAHSVRPVLQVVAPVASDGAGWSPNFVPLALWMGAVMTAFLFHYGRLPAELMAAPRAANVAGRLVFPALVVTGQALVMLAMLVGVLQVPLSRVLPAAATLLGASLMFLCLIFALVHLFGDTGKMIAVLLLVVQISAGDALLPIDLTPGVFRALHQWMPLSWVVQAFRASVFGAFEDHWAGAWMLLVLAGAGVLSLAAVFGRWRPVPAQAYRPTMEVD
jgi:putative membrane protein